MLVLWDLSSGSKATFAQLRDYLRTESIARFSKMPGLRLKTWISNEDTGRWGALYLFETHAQADDLVSHIRRARPTELTGLEPATIEQFDLEAVTEGVHAGAELLSAGLARATQAPTS